LLGVVIVVILVPKKNKILKNGSHFFYFEREKLIKIEFKRKKEGM